LVGGISFSIRVHHVYYNRTLCGIIDYEELLGQLVIGPELVILEEVLVKEAKGYSLQRIRPK
jgi:hypothetical protein